MSHRKISILLENDRWDHADLGDVADVAARVFKTEEEASAAFLNLRDVLGKLWEDGRTQKGGG